MSFLKKGKAAQQEMAKAQAKADEMAKEKVFRFRIPTGANTSVTFLDGDLTDDGVLDIPMYHEHQIHMNGRWDNWFVCVQDEGSCPLCEGGDEPALVGALTIIDHSEWKDKKGNMHKDERKLFIAKFATIQMLQVLATKRGGLTGCTFDVYRSSEKRSPNVGTTFDFTEKHTPTGLKKKYKDDATPYDYEEVLTYLPADELRKMGFGVTGVGGEKPLDDSEGTGEEYEKDL